MGMDVLSVDDGETFHHCGDFIDPGTQSQELGLL